MIIPIEIGKLKKCKGCNSRSYCRTMEFKFNFATCEIDCFTSSENYHYYYENGEKIYEKYKQWSKNKKTHRDDGPAYIQYDQRGKVRGEEWYKDGNFIRQRYYNTDGSLLGYNNG